MYFFLNINVNIVKKFIKIGNGRKNDEKLLVCINFRFFKSELNRGEVRF